MQYIQFIDILRPFNQILPPIYSYLLMAIIAGIFILLAVYSNGKLRQNPIKPERFRLEITEMSESYVRCGLNVPDGILGQDIGATLRTGLTIIGKKDPLVLRIILLQTLEVLSEEEDIQEALKDFGKIPSCMS